MNGPPARRRPAPRASRWLWLLLLLLVCLSPQGAVAETPPALVFDVGHMPDQSLLATHLTYLEDAQGKLQLADVRRDPEARRFRAVREREISFGFSDAAVWLRLVTTNRSPQEVVWLLALEQPTLDDIQLYTVRADGRINARQTGDMFPFATRDVPHATFNFELTSPPGEAVTYYLRVRSNNSLRMPVRAWRVPSYLAEHERNSSAYWLFYGALAVLAIYNVAVFCLVRSREHLWYALMALAVCGAQMSLNGHMSQFVLPSWPALANRVLPVTIAIALSSVALFTREVIKRAPASAGVRRVVPKAVVVTYLVVAFVCVAPIAAANHVVRAVLLITLVLGPFFVRAVYVRDVRELRLYHLCWYALIVTVPIVLLRNARLVPPFPLSEWALQIGFVVHGVMISLALASWGDGMRAKLGAVNAQLTSNVDNLRLALARAEDANQQALRATKAKDDFVATMSHELRTPLNAIINIPQGLIREFEEARAARCTTCGASFLLDPGDRVTPGTVCEACAARGTLQEGSKLVYKGDLVRCLRFLQKIERSGQHLLQMVNGVLDYSKMEAGRFQLSLAPADLEALTREVVDQMSEIAQRKDVQLLVSTVSEPPPVTVDALRIKQVLINLIANAIKFSEASAVVGVVLSRAGDTAMIEVQDSGIGIAKEDHERIFNAFEQVHTGDTRKYGGTGLGLSISRSLVRMHGGELTVKSELGSGATFVVRLPKLPNIGISQVSQVSEAGASQRLSS